MPNAFKEFLEAEIGEMLASMDEGSRQDPELRVHKAIEWIDRNAARFREEWMRAHPQMELY
ncbi:MAG: hypothetical protein GF398_12780 [Chitinivibrionales bacterium]|nr:hypothetical protein [Chitinivibrionales bacterium]